MNGLGPVSRTPGWSRICSSCSSGPAYAQVPAVSAFTSHGMTSSAWKSPSTVGCPWNLWSGAQGCTVPKNHTLLILHTKKPAWQLAQPNAATASISPLSWAKKMSIVHCESSSRSPTHSQFHNCISLQGAEMIPKEAIGSWQVEVITAWRMGFHSTLEMEISP